MLSICHVNLYACLSLSDVTTIYESSLSVFYWNFEYTFLYLTYIHTYHAADAKLG